jgi:hypothetical protein
MKTDNAHEVSLIDSVTRSRAGSWIALERATLRAVYETFQHSVACKINQDKFIVLPAGEALAIMNQRIKEQDSSK